jgi:hypothetical protein
VNAFLKAATSRIIKDSQPLSMRIKMPLSNRKQIRHRDALARSVRAHFDIVGLPLRLSYPQRWVLLSMQRARRKRRSTQPSSPKRVAGSRQPLADVTGDVEHLRNREAQRGADARGRLSQARATQVKKARLLTSAKAVTPTLEANITPEKPVDAITAGDGLRQLTSGAPEPSGNDSDKSVEIISLSTPTSTEEELVTFERRFRKNIGSSVFEPNAEVPESNLRSSTTERLEPKRLSASSTTGAPSVQARKSRARRLRSAKASPINERSSDKLTPSAVTTGNEASNLLQEQTRVSHATVHARVRHPPGRSPALKRELVLEQAGFWDQVDQEELLIEDVTSSVTSAECGMNTCCDPL